MIGHMSAVSREAQRFSRRGEGAPHVHGRHLTCSSLPPRSSSNVRGWCWPWLPRTNHNSALNSTDTGWTTNLRQHSLQNITSTGFQKAGRHPTAGTNGHLLFAKSLGYLRNSNPWFLESALDVGICWSLGLCPSKLSRGEKPLYLN